MGSPSPGSGSIPAALGTHPSLGDILSAAPEFSFIHPQRLPGSPSDIRAALARAVGEGMLLRVRHDLYYRPRHTRFGPTHPRVEDVVREVLGPSGWGPAGFSAASLWRVSTQVSPRFHVASVHHCAPIAGVRFEWRDNTARTSLNQWETALLEVLRAPEVLLDSGWEDLVARVGDAVARGAVRWELVRAAGALEPHPTTRGNVAALAVALET